MTAERNESGPEGDRGEPRVFVKPAARPSLMARLRAYFLTGIVVTAPIGITIYIAWAFIDFVDATVTPLIPPQYQPETLFKVSIPGLGIVIVMVGLTVIGFLTANFLGRALIRIGERIVERMPVIRSVYGALKQILETVLNQSSNAFRQCVLIEYPRKGLWVVAFVTADTEGEVKRRLDQDLVSVFVPTTPNPTSGFILFVPKEDLVFLDMPVEDGMKLVVSAGMVTPPDKTAPDYAEAVEEGAGWRKRQASLMRAMRGNGEKPKSSTGS